MFEKFTAFLFFICLAVNAFLFEFSLAFSAANVSLPGHSLAFFGSESTPQFLVCSMLRLGTDALSRFNRTAMLTQDPFEVRSGRSSTVRLERLVYQSLNAACPVKERV